MKIQYTIKETGETGVANSGWWDYTTEDDAYSNEENARMISRKLGVEMTGFRNIYPAEDYDEEDIRDGVDSDYQFETDQILLENIWWNPKTVVVTRHKGLVDYLKEINMIDYDTIVVEQVDDVDQIKGCHVIGVLPPHLAIYANKVTTIPLNTPHDLRGKELTLDQVREYAGKPFTYSVQPE